MTEFIRCEVCKRKKATKKLTISNYEEGGAMETYLCESCFEKIKNLTENLRIREFVRCEMCRRKKAVKKLIIQNFDDDRDSIETYLCGNCVEEIKNLIEKKIIKKNPNFNWWW